MENIEELRPYSSVGVKDKKEDGVQELSQGKETLPSKDREPHLYRNWDDWNSDEIEFSEIGTFKDSEEDLPYIPFDASQLVRELRSSEFRSRFRKNHPDIDLGKVGRGIRQGLEIQQRHILSIVKDLYQMIRTNPDTSFDEFTDYINNKAPEARLTPTQKFDFRQALNGYVLKHRAVDRSYKAYEGDEYQFFADCFGVYPEDEVKVSKGPMTIHFHLKDEDFIHASAYPKTKGNSFTIAPEVRERAMKSAGMALRSVGIERLHNAVIISRNSVADEATTVHEEQHQFNALFSPLEYSMELDEIFIYSDDISPEVAAYEMFTRFAQLQRRVMGIDRQARDEIIAYYREGADFELIYSLLTTSDLYAYRDMDNYREKINEIKKTFNIKLREKNFLSEEHINAIRVNLSVDTVNQILKDVFEWEYNSDIKEWLKAVNTMEEKNYSRDDIISLLYVLPVYRWRKVTERIQHYVPDLPAYPGISMTYTMNDLADENTDEWRNFKDLQDLVKLDSFFS